MKKIYSLIAVLCCCLSAAHAQNVTFETQDYKAVGVYDMWEESPFRTGALTGNAAVVDNPFKDETNASDKVLGVQRSRFGSNMFGVRIDLNETFELTTTQQFVHVLMHKPNTNRVMLMGLGKHKSDNAFWSYQTEDVEQFWEPCLATVEVQADEWFDAIFAVKGAGNIDIYSLVVVVDAVSPHALAEDFVAYVDDIEVNTSNRSRTALAGDYPICFAKLQAYTRTDRKLNGISLNSPSAGNQTLSVDNNLCYNELFAPSLLAKAGETVTPAVSYKGSWMCSYVYVDKGRDGNFSYDVADNGGVSPESDLVSFSALNTKNGRGESLPNNNVITPTPFTIPANLPKGIYRMRYKVDWNNANPAGNDGSSGSNYIIDNGGGIIDVRLNVHEDQVSIARSGGLNGDIVHADGTEFDTETIPFGQPYTIYMKPAPGFSVDSLIVRHGYHLDSEALHKSTPQWVEDVVHASEFAADGSFTIPAEWVDGDIKLMPEFVESAAVVNFQYDYQWKGISKKTEEVSAKVGNPFPDVDGTGFPAYTKVTKPEGTVTAELNGTAYVVEIQPDGLPFECFNSLAEVTRWYNVSLKEKFIYDQGTDATIALTHSDPVSEDNSFVWGFVGNPFDGFRLFNYATHKVLATNLANIGSNTGGSTYAVTVQADPLPAGWYDVWDISQSAQAVKGFYLAVRGQGDGKYRMNDRDDKLSFWTTGADAGSTFRVMEAKLAEPKVTVSITAAKFATLHYADQALSVPAGIVAWTFTGDERTILAVKSYEQEAVIPAGTAVLLQGEEGDYDFLLSQEAGLAPAVNLLKGGTPTDLSRTYILSNGEAGIGFYKAAADFVNGEHKAFLELPVGVEARAFSLDDLFNGVETGLCPVAAAARPVVYHDLSGRRVAKPRKGVYLMNGTQVMVR